MSEKDFLVVGLGNIGAEYAQTRHNAGFIVLDAWAQASNTFFVPERYGDLCSVSFKGREFHLLKPSTYMNLSGNAVRYYLNELNIDQSHLIVICDDLNLPFGSVRMRPAGSNGGHNGLRNIEELIGTQSYARIRVGVGHDFEKGEQVSFVLGKFNDQELETLSELSERIIPAVKTWALVGAQKAMTQLNSKPSTKSADQ